MKSGSTKAGVVAVVAVVLGGLLGSCSDDEADALREEEAERRPTSTTIVPSRPLASAGGDATAAEGSGLDEAPGPADRDRDRFELFGEVAIAIRAPDGSVTGWCVLLAERDEQRQRGLMEVTDFGGYAGMLFVWEQDSSSSFYMRNTPTPLSIAWFDRDGELVSTKDMAPCGERDDCPLYGPDGGQPYRFALEVPRGELPSLGVEPGSVLRVGGDCAARSP